MEPKPEKEPLMHGPSGKERVTVDEACVILGVSARTVQRMTNAGKLPTAAKIGRLWTYNEQALRAWVSEQEQQHVRHVANAPQRSRPAPSTSRIPNRRDWSDGASSESSSRKVLRALREEAKLREAEARKRRQR
ncbi:helix-turn-helix domain-containing protein [Methylobacterium aquaticum]|uniref:helix-turn-helix domain-containing protein n=1 Tax=Methylobacterium aquaticum TaxID=270351 RepID=UPI0009E275CE